MMKYLFSALIVACVFGVCVAQDAKESTIQPGDRVVVELFDDAAVKYLSEIRDRFISDHYIVPVICTVERIADDGRLVLSGYSKQKTSFFGRADTDGDERVLTITLTIEAKHLKSTLAAKKYSDPIFQSAAIRALPSVLIAAPTQVEVSSWQPVPKVDREE